MHQLHSKLLYVDFRSALEKFKFLTQDTAPVVKDLTISYQKVWFNGSFLKANIFRQDAGPEVDAAWKSLGADCKLFS